MLEWGNQFIHTKETGRLKKGAQPRVLLSLCETAGFYASLSKGFKSIGVPAEVATRFIHPFAYPIKPFSFVHRFAIWVFKLRYEKNLPVLFKKMIVIFDKTYLRPLFLKHCIKHFDVFIFGSGVSFFEDNSDLPLLKEKGKTIICIFHGSDARPPYLDVRALRLTLEALKATTYAQKKKLTFIEQHADYIINAPASSVWHERPIVNWFAIGIPFVSTNEYALESEETDIPMILHCPSDPQAKGSEHVRAAIRQLHKKGYEFNYIELIDKSHAEVLSSIRDCAFVIDQLYSDTPLAGFATEAAWHGKPAIVGGYELHKLTDYLSDDLRAASYQIVFTPETLEDGIENLLNDSKLRSEIGQKASDFVRSHWNPEAIAKKLLDLSQGNGLEKEQFDPANLDMINGWGIDSQERRLVIKAYVQAFGVDALCLHDKPQYLESLIRDLELQGE